MLLPDLHPYTILLSIFLVLVVKQLVATIGKSTIKICMVGIFKGFLKPIYKDLQLQTT